LNQATLAATPGTAEGSTFRQAQVRKDIKVIYHPPYSAPSASLSEAGVKKMKFSYTILPFNETVEKHKMTENK